MAEQSLVSRVMKMLGGNMAAVVLQAVQFILLARTLGVEEYSAFAAVAAIVAICLPLAGLGYANVMLMEIARDRGSAPVQVGNTLAATASMGAALTFVVATVAYLLYGPEGGWLLALVLGFSELVLVRINLAISQVYQAFDQIGKCSRINVTNSLARVVAVLILLLQDEPQAIGWAAVALLLLAIVAAWNYHGLKKVVPIIRLDFSRLRRDASEATYHALGTTAKAGYTDLDKVILAKYGQANQVGEYTSAYRLATMAFMPVRSLLDVIAAKFFRVGQTGMAPALQLSKKMFLFAVPYSLIVGVAMVVFSPVVPMILGEGFGESAEIIKWLAPLPLIQSIYYILSAALTSAGYQKIRTLIQFFALAIYAVLGLVYIPNNGWNGAVLVCITSETMLVVFVAAACALIVRREANERGLA